MNLSANNSYNDYYKILTFCKNSYSGSPSVQTHLKQFLRETDSKFTERKEDTNFDNFVKRTIQGITNIIMRKELKYDQELNSEQQEIIDSIDLKSSLNEFAKEIIRKRLRDGFTFILVDSPKVNAAMSKYDEKVLNIRPYFISLDRASVINYQEKDDGTFSFVVYQEVITLYDASLVETSETITKVWTDDGIVRIYVDGTLSETIETGLAFVPIIKYGDDTIPPIYDLAKLNVSHMNRNSELDNYIRVAAAPIPITYQMDNSDGGVITVGVNEGINFSSSKNEAGFEWVSLKAENTEAIRQRIQDLEVSMLNIAVTFATSSKVKTATQVDKEATEDESKLSDIAQTLEEILNKSLEMLTEFDPSLRLPYVMVNNDFDSNKMTTEQIDRLLTMYREGVISLETLWSKLEQGEILEIEDKDKEKVAINDL